MGLINPTLPTANQPRGGEEVDVINALTALLNLVNGSLDSANVAAAALNADRLHASILATYKTLEVTTFALHDLMSGNAAGVRWANQGPTADASQQMGGLSNVILTRSAPLFFPFDPADYAITGKALKLRVRMALMTNSVAPGGNFTAGMYSCSPLFGAADALGLTTFNLVAGSPVTRNTPASGSKFSDVGVDFDAPAAGVYMLGLNPSAAIPADSVVAARIMLQYHHV